MIRYKSSKDLGIVSIKCPHCENHKLILKEKIILGMGKNKMIENTWWECPSCVFTFDAEWFNKIKTHEEFVTRIKGIKRPKFGAV